MSETYLLLQVLGTNDILVDGDPEGLWNRIKGLSQEDLEQNFTLLQQDFQENAISVEFSLIESLVNRLKTEDRKLIFGVILSDQREWVKHREQTIDDCQIWELVAKDGIWAESFLEQWLRKEQPELESYLLPFQIDDNFQFGVADWEATDNKITPFLRQYLIQEDSGFSWQNGSNKTKIDKIIIQHSTGTPALKGSLYLWGIEKKLANYPIEFIYLSEDESCIYDETPTHTGKYWQWHLRLPLIRELLAIKDFSGALQLVENIPTSHVINNSYIVEELEFLDEAVSFNLTKRNITGRAGIIERIAIALWSEASFRKRKHWMDWYLRLVGAFELAILLLLENRGQYQWQGQKLIFDSTGKKKYREVGLCGIKNIIQELLSNGYLDYEFFNSGKSTKFVVKKVVEDKKWIIFKKFYLTNWVELKIDNPGFSSLRNKLYHQLIGDVIDKALDDSPGAADEAIKKLDYLLELGKISEEIKERKNFYQKKYNELLQQLF